VLPASTLGFSRHLHRPAAPLMLHVRSELQQLCMRRALPNNNLIRFMNPFV